MQAFLEEGLALRDRYHHHEISLHGLWTATGRLEVELDHVLARRYHDAANRRLSKHLRHERPYLFTFVCTVPAWMPLAMRPSGTS